MDWRMDNAITICPRSSFGCIKMFSWMLHSADGITILQHFTSTYCQVYGNKFLSLSLSLALSLSLCMTFFCLPCLSVCLSVCLYVCFSSSPLSLSLSLSLSHSVKKCSSTILSRLLLCSFLLLCCVCFSGLSVFTCEFALHIYFCSIPQQVILKYYTVMYVKNATYS